MRFTITYFRYVNKYYAVESINILSEVILMNKVRRVIFKIKSRFMRMSSIERAEYLRKYSEITIGEGCEIHGDVLFGSEPYLIKLGNKVRITEGVKFINHDGGMWVVRNIGFNSNAGKIEPIEVGNNVMIGINSIIMQGVKIGSNVVVGAGSIVTKDIPNNVVVAGVPAKKVCTIEDYYNKNLQKLDDTKKMTHDERKRFYKQKFNM